MNAGVLTVDEISKIRQSAELNAFTARVDPDGAGEVADAVATVQERHPSEVIWIETSTSVA